MGKRALLAFFLSLLVIISYNNYMAKKYPLPQPKTSSGQDPDTRLPSSEVQVQPDGEQPFVAQAPLQPAYPAQVTREAKEIVVETDLIKLVITASGARIKSCQLKRYPE